MGRLVFLNTVLLFELYASLLHTHWIVFDLGGGDAALVGDGIR